MRSLFLILSAAVVCLSAAGCSTDNRRLVYLTHHFREHELNGSYRKLNADVIGAQEAARFASREGQFNLEFARFDNPKAAARLAQAGFRHPNGQTVHRVYANGHFTMIIRSAADQQRVVNVFNEF